MILIDDKNREVERVLNRDYGDSLRWVDSNILANRWIDGDLSLVKNISTIMGIYNFKYEHEAWTKYYMNLRDLEIISDKEYIILIDSIQEK